MSNPSPVRALYAVEALAPDGDCVRARLKPAGRTAGAAPLEARFCAPAIVALLRRTVDKRGYVAAHAAAGGGEPGVLPAVIAVRLEVMQPDGSTTRVAALPRPAPVRIRNDDTSLLALVRSAIASESGAVFAIDPATDMVADAALIPRAEAEALLGLVRR